MSNEEDLDSWISSIQMVGVNSRNLATLKTDVTLFETMVEKLPREATWVAESGIASASDIAVLRQSGYSGFLIGDAYGQACRTRHVRRWPVSFRLSQHHHEALQHQSMRNDLRSKCDEGFGP